MPTLLAIPVFLASTAVTLAAASFFATRLDHIGLRFGLPETLLGLLTALAADAPEVSSALVALAKGEQGVAVGVVVGSNAFNIAAMLGLSALLAGGVRLPREAVIFEGFVGLWVTGVVAVLAAGGIGAPVALVLVALVVVPYVILLARGPAGASSLPLGARSIGFLQRTFGERHRPQGPHTSHGEAVLIPTLLLLASLAIVVLGSVGMVTAAVDLADASSVPRALVGVIVLAILTSLPNASTAIRLGLQGRGSALVSETLNSNSINLVAGIVFPGVIVGIGALSTLDAFGLGWLVLMTVAALVLLSRRGGPTRAGGALLIGLYLVFVVVQIAANV